MAVRKAASVFPEPVGASTSVCFPAAIGGQPLAWAGVGLSKLRRNQSATGGEKARSGSAATPEAYRCRIGV